MACPPLEQLTDLIRGTIDRNHEATLKAHMSSGCRTCAENHRWLKTMLAATAEDDSFDFSEDTIRWSVAQFKAASASQPSRIQILARLIFDNLLPGQAVEVRSMAAPAVSRQILYEAGPYDVDLRLEQLEEKQSILILGQIVGRDAKSGGLVGVSVEIKKHGGDAQENGQRAETDARGMFRLRDVAPGEYDIIIHAPEGELLINAITCGPQ
jgi:hypothetical protein